MTIHTPPLLFWTSNIYLHYIINLIITYLREINGYKLSFYDKTIHVNVEVLNLKD